MSTRRSRLTGRPFSSNTVTYSLPSSSPDVPVSGRNRKAFGKLPAGVGAPLPQVFLERAGFAGYRKRIALVALRREGFALKLQFHFVGAVGGRGTKQIQGRSRQRNGLARLVNGFVGRDVDFDAVGNKLLHAHRLRGQQDLVGILHLDAVTARYGGRVEGHVGRDGSLAVGRFAESAVFAAVGHQYLDQQRNFAGRTARSGCGQWC